MSNLIHPLILGGGAGTRLWPLSRRSFPKQFTKILSEESLFQMTALRLSGSKFAAPYIITNSDFRFISLEQLSEVKVSHEKIIIEPEAKNTAAVARAAAILLDECTPGALMLVAPSDTPFRMSLDLKNVLKAQLKLLSKVKLLLLGSAQTAQKLATDGWN